MLFFSNKKQHFGKKVKKTVNLSYWALRYIVKIGNLFIKKK
jgi:hypothetical protein